MSTLVVYESMYGNTRAVADAIGEALTAAGHDAKVVAVADAPQAPDADLLIVGGPTHMHGLTTSLSRRMAVKAAEEDDHPVEPGAEGEFGLRQWLKALPQRDGALAAAFDTRGDAKAALTGSAARGIARRLRHRGYTVLESSSYLVEDSEGPLQEGELGHAQAWARTVAAARTPAAEG
jgi:cytochrome c biogenesis protein ResB